MSTAASLVVPYSPDTAVYSLRTDREPAAVIEPGQSVIFETMNAFSQETDSEEELNEVIGRGFHHPFTGPVEIIGARPGMTVAVHIESIELGGYAYTCISRSSGVLKGRFPFRNYKKLPIEGGSVRFEGISIPVHPSLGGAGLADPAGTRNGATGKHGGNFDFRWLVPGSTLYLPVAVPGGGLYVGDVHALQGNGELSGIALEASGRVGVSVGVHARPIDGPILHLAQGLLVVGYGETFEEAVETAADLSVKLTADRLGLKPADAYVLLGCSADLIIGHLTGRIKSVGVLIPPNVLTVRHLFGA